MYWEIKSYYNTLLTNSGNWIQTYKAYITPFSKVIFVKFGCTKNQ